MLKIVIEKLLPCFPGIKSFKIEKSDINDEFSNLEIIGFNNFYGETLYLKESIIVNKKNFEECYLFELPLKITNLMHFTLKSNIFDNFYKTLKHSYDYISLFKLFTCNSFNYNLILVFF